MSTVNFKGFDDFAKRAPGLMRRSAEMAGTELAEVTVANLARKAIALTPVGPSEEAARRASGGGSGHMRDLWFKVIGSTGGQSGYMVPARQHVELRPGETSKIVNSAAHANAINWGRKRSRPYALETAASRATRTPGRRRRGSIVRGEEFTRMLGSLQAKNGVTKPLMSWATAKRESFIKVAIRRAEAKVR